MEHPLIGDISHLSIEDLSSKITELHKKLGIAQRIGNGHVGHQIRMALESYQNQYQQRLKEQAAASGKNFDSVINIE
jgi:hypothetical protein